MSWGCHMDGPGVCIARGDLHFTTFDGRNFDVYGNCTYLLASHCPTWEDLGVEVQNQKRGAANVSFQHVKMVVSGYSVKMSNDCSNRVMVGSFICHNKSRQTMICPLAMLTSLHLSQVNGLLLHLPSVLSQGKVKLYMTGLSKCID